MLSMVAWVLWWVCVLALDQASKYWALTHLLPGHSWAVWPGVNFSLVFNRGAAFGWLHQATGWQHYFFLTLATVVSMGLLWWFRCQRGFLPRLAIVTLLGGIVGNVIDRWRYGAVVDFIDLYIGRYHWPVFNVADSAIVLGVILLLWNDWQTRATK